MKKIYAYLFSILLFSAFLYASFLQIPQIPESTLLKAAAFGAMPEQSPHKIKSFFMVGISDTVLSPETIRFISENNIGGILLLSRNIKSKNQLQKLTRDIHAVRSDIIIAVDQEGGEISRILFSGNDLTPQKDIKTETDAYLVARRRAEKLRFYGIDMDFSPVADYITNPDSFLYERTFRANPDEIAVLAGAMIRGYEDGGIIPVLKHFPGHTDFSTDTHNGIVRIKISKELLSESILPFKKIIERTPPPAIMVGGTTYESFEENPAALSKTIVRNLLRDELGFKGMIISDDLEMDAFSNFSPKERAIRALEAGCTVVIFSQTKTTQDELERIIRESLQEV